MKRKLSVREEQILVLICEGFTRGEIASLMGKSPHTIKEIARRIRVKTGCHRLAKMVMWAVAHRIVEPQKYYPPQVHSAPARVSIE